MTSQKIRTPKISEDEKRRRNAEAMRKRRAADPAKHVAEVAAWRAANPEKYNSYNAKRMREQRAKDPDAANAKGRARYWAKRGLTPEQGAALAVAKAEKRRRERAQQAQARNDRSRERSRQWRLANPGKSQVLQKAWREANRDKVRATKRDRKIAKRKATIAHLMALQHGACAYCRCSLTGITIHIDHILPRALGGSNERKNLQLTCEPCNLRKNATPPEKFILQFGRLL